jgi:AbrB family looped-hinge helix DNA binding protein
VSKVTSKLQVTIPKTVARQYGIEPGSDVVFEPAGEVIRLRPPGPTEGPESLDLDTRLRLFDEASARQKRRDDAWADSRPATGLGASASFAADRGWTREELYDRVPENEEPYDRGPKREEP